MLQVYLQRMPELAGKTFGELVLHLPQATAYGLVQSRSRRCLLNPPADTLIDRLDEIVMIRATDLSEAEMQPLAEPADMDIGMPALLLICTAAEWLANHLHAAMSDHRELCGSHTQAIFLI